MAPSPRSKTRKSDRRASASRRGLAPGYTLLELLVVLAILVVIAAIAVPQVIGYLDRAKADAARVEIDNLVATLDLFRLDVGRYPTQGEGLDALFVQPSGAERWNGPYLRKRDMLLDPWNAPYLYRFPGQNGAIDLYSLGADGSEGGEGIDRDITSW